MPRANRTYVAGQVWHLTHRCHKREFLLRFVKDRCCWLRWLFEAKKRYRLCILDFIVTCNHIHLLVLDQGLNEIPHSMQLIASQTAQRYNKRRHRSGAYWQDRYHATAVQMDIHLRRCLVYIDLNMVRANVISHPSDWLHSGYREIQSPPLRYRIVDLEMLTKLCGFNVVANFQSAHRGWIEAALRDGATDRQPCWTEQKAVGTTKYIDEIETALTTPDDPRILRRPKLVVKE
jgi:putative transposase